MEMNVDIKKFQLQQFNLNLFCIFMKFLLLWGWTQNASLMIPITLSAPLRLTALLESWTTRLCELELWMTRDDERCFLHNLSNNNLLNILSIHAVSFYAVCPYGAPCSTTGKKKTRRRSKEIRYERQKSVRVACCVLHFGMNQWKHRDRWVFVLLVLQPFLLFFLDTGTTFSIVCLNT